MIFRDRTEAGRRLAATLSHLRGRPDVLVLALPRGGVPVAAEVARTLSAPLDLCFAHKLGAPDNAELAIGAVSETGVTYVEERMIHSMRVPFSYVREEAAFQQKELDRRARWYRGDRPPPEIEDKWVVLVDDGVATGATAVVALRTIRVGRPARLIFGTPVAAAETVQRVAKEADELAVLHAPTSFLAVGEFYDRFPQVTDAEVMALLHAANPE